jgi:hypothetical protein
LPNYAPTNQSYRLKPDTDIAEMATMGLRSLWRQSQQRTSRHPIQPVLLKGGETVEVVGESHYLPALLQLTGRRQQEHVRQEVVASLVPEPTNPYDPNAVSVHVDGRQVGYLSRHDAVAYASVIGGLASEGHVGACRGWICGREGTPNLGVFLDLAAPHDALGEY